jgi:hypothetical protein
LSRLPGLVALGVLPPAQANTIRATYSTLLQSHDRHEKVPARTIDNELVRHLRKNPRLANLVEPFLTKDQIEMVLRGDIDPENEDAEDVGNAEDVRNAEDVEDVEAEDVKDAEEAEDVGDAEDEDADEAEDVENAEDAEDEGADDVDPFS